MEDDLENAVEHEDSFYRPKLFAQMGELSQHRITRNRARAAMQQLCLIQNDDETERGQPVCGRACIELQVALIMYTGRRARGRFHFH